MLCRQKDLTNISGTSAHDSGPENEPPPSPQEDMPTSNTGMPDIKSVSFRTDYTCNICQSSTIISCLVLLGSGLMEDQKEPIGSSSSTEDPEESVGEEKDKPTEEADLAQKKQEEVSPSPTQNKEEVTEEIQADLEVNEPQSENKQEEEDKVDTFFSTMSHRYEAPLLL